MAVKGVDKMVHDLVVMMADWRVDRWIDELVLSWVVLWGTH
jgi:hypothetical protein